MFVLTPVMKVKSTLNLSNQTSVNDFMYSTVFTFEAYSTVAMLDVTLPQPTIRILTYEHVFKNRFNCIPSWSHETTSSSTCAALMELFVHRADPLGFRVNTPFRRQA